MPDAGIHIICVDIAWHYISIRHTCWLGRFGRVCCAVDCHERQGQDPSISFFKVKSKRNPARSEAWIRAIKRDNEDGTPWQPNDYSVLCGRHFITGKPSDIPSSPDYAPTIFTTGHCRPASMQDVERLNRVSQKIGQSSSW